MSITYNSWLENYKKPFGALELGEKLSLNIKATENVKEVYLVLERDGNDLKEIEMTKTSDDIFNIDGYEFQQEDIYFYFFKIVENINGNNIIKYYGKNNKNGMCEETFDIDRLNKYQITVSKKTKSPNWFKEGVLYHIFVDKFNRSGKINNPKKNSFVYANWEDTPMYIKNSENEIIRWDFHGGNLKGIISKLSYLKNLGVSIIYLSPIFESQSNHKYDTGDYKNIDPMFGNEEIFKELINEANKKGINIILDGVFSHTGDDSVYFNRYGNYDSIGAYQSQDSPYSSWYKFENYPQKYDCWWGVKSLPNVNETETSYIDYIIKGDDSVIKKWMGYGVKGWRLDVADELPSKFIEELKSETLKLDKESILVGEVWEDASNKISYDERRKYLLGDQLNGVTGYVFKNIFVDFLNYKIDSNDVYNSLMTIKENYPKESFKSNLTILGTHDTRRILTELNEDKELLKLAVAIQMTFEGVPYIYYGDEAGLLGETDPDNRRTYPWKNEDKEILNFYKNIIKDRNKSKVLTCGETKFLELENPNVFGYVRYIEGINEENILILVNRSEQEEVIKIDMKECLNSKYVNLVNGLIEVNHDIVEFKLESKSHKLVKLEKANN
ncbi:glycoside hydrolase family 13 protein [Paraclostridium bifermentans]|uniref:glycoside hydrolase family 13 protein n=1 Tax=Paraclostridium bifermentans TaxID=1490 RepID=UPI00290F4D04|nr:glycoside hydrolase family 13 protein [Paraclostridium bifermentans]MDU3803373.1 glycoside hydrolase family 13 protein [Paraclostridium bifermentans]